LASLLIYTTVKWYLYPQKKSRDLQSIFPLVYGVNLLITLLVYPLDTVKTRMMMSTCGSPKQYALSIGTQIFHKETLPSFYRGFSVAMIQLIPLSFVMSVFHKYRQEEWEKKCSTAFKVEGTAVAPTEEELDLELKETKKL